MSEVPILAYIHDGYTREAYIQPHPRLYPALRFTYRPVLAQDRAVIYRHIERTNDPRKEETIAAEFMRRQLLDWDVTNAGGEAVALEVTNILRLQPRLLTRLFRIVMGDESPDEEPEPAPLALQCDAERDARETLQGDLFAREEATEKN